jgi:hypothetical protein
MKIKICLVVISLFCCIQAFDLSSIKNIGKPDVRSAKWGQTDAEIMSQENSASDNPEYVGTVKRKDPLTGAMNLIMTYHNARLYGHRGELLYVFKRDGDSWELTAATFYISEKKDKDFDRTEEHISDRLIIDYTNNYKILSDENKKEYCQWDRGRTIITNSVDFYNNVVTVSFRSAK